MQHSSRSPELLELVAGKAREPSRQIWVSSIAREVAVREAAGGPGMWLG